MALTRTQKLARAAAQIAAGHPDHVNCFYCNRILTRKTKTLDHIRPRSKGGSNSKRNVVDCCEECNRDKGCLSIDEFRLVMAFRLGLLKASTYKFPGEIRKK